MNSRLLGLALSLALALSLSSCLEDGPSTETGNPNLGGTLTDTQGNPIPGQVKLFRLPVTTDTSAALPPMFVKTETVKADGKWGFDSLPAAVYAVEGVDAAGARFGLLRGLELAEPKDTLVRALAVAAPGRVHGRATRGSNALPPGIQAHEKILVRMDGADRWTLTDTAGDYAIANVPAGTFKLAFAATDGHYITAYRDGIAVAAGAVVTVPKVDLEWSRFIAPPAVRGVVAIRDSAANAVALKWRAVTLSGGAQVLYSVTRRDSLNAALGLYQGPDTFFTDTLGNIPRGTLLSYSVRAINPFGEKGPADTLPPLVAPGRIPDGPAIGMLEGVVHSKGTALAAARVRLFTIPSAPGSPDAMPDSALNRDSVLTDAMGRWRFADLAAGSYTVVALGKAGTAAIRMGLVPRASGAKLDSLEPLATGTVEGAATRNRQWVTSNDKGDENIHVSLAGAPFTLYTRYGFPPDGAAFSFANVPPGTYKLVVYPLPIGYFLPDSQTVVVAPGATVKLPAVVKAGYNPNAPPPKLASLKIAAATRARVSLAWDIPPGGYPYLKGYRVLRLSAGLKALDSSAVIPDLHWEDDISKVAVGTELKYVIRVVALNGREGEPGGFGLLPVPHTVSGP